jgi:hypothetical protein
MRPYVVYDVARGTLLVDAQLLSGLQKLQQVQTVVSASAAAFLEHLAGMLAQVRGRPHHFHRLLLAGLCRWLAR